MNNSHAQNLEFPHWRSLPSDEINPSTALENRFAAVENFQRTFAFRPGERVVMLLDRLLDPRVIHAITGLALSRGATPSVYLSHTPQESVLPDEIKPLLDKADFVISTWYCAISDPLANALRERGQRWVKITYFRNLDVLDTPAARFPIDVIGEIIRTTASQYPKGKDFQLKVSDARGTDLRVDFTPQMRDKHLAGNRWRGVMTADEPGCYVHYVACHGPNLYDAWNPEDPTLEKVNGVLYPQGAIGFPGPFKDKIAIEIRRGLVTSVEGSSEEAKIFRDMLIGGFLSEVGCGFNPKASRFTAYPAGSNSPGALHFGIDFAEPSNYIKRVMPNWEEPPLHMDFVCFDMTAAAGATKLVDQGFLTALREPAVIAAASVYGEPVDLLENFPG
ncbi:MAG: hypothetical protein AB7K04_01375 [Pseudorhodoplanes sp.]